MPRPGRPAFPPHLVRPHTAIVIAENKRIGPEILGGGFENGAISAKQGQTREWEKRFEKKSETEQTTSITRPQSIASSRAADCCYYYAIESRE